MSDCNSVSGLVSEIANLDAMKKSIFENPNTHMQLREQLVDHWDSVVALFDYNEAHAAEFLLSENPQLDEKSPADVILSGEEGVKRYNEFINSMHLSFA